MFAETKKVVLVEYPIDVVYDTLVLLFPFKIYELTEYDDVLKSFRVIDSYNPTFVMDIHLVENTPNTTIINFMANYPHAIMDLTNGGTQVIETILEELLHQLDKLPRTGTIEAQNSNIEIVNAENFVNSTKNKTHYPAIVVGYILCFLSFILPLIALINYDPDDIIMFMFFMIGILCLSMEISLSVILQYYENSKSIFHGGIQTCICGFLLIIFGFLIHPSLIIGGILIPVITIVYFIKRRKAID